METFDLNKMVRGWFIGDFEPSCLKTDQFEISVRKYAAGEGEKNHVHKVSTEFTVIVSGKVYMNGTCYEPWTIIEIKPGEYTDFYAVIDSVTVVVKVPCVKGDKYDTFDSTQG